MPANELRLSKGDYLVREGEASTDMYYVQEGTLGVYKKKSSGDIQIGTIYSGELVGEMSFLDGSIRSATVKAMSDCVLMQIPHHMMDDIEKKLPPWYKALMRTLLDRLRKANAKVKV